MGCIGLPKYNTYMTLCKKHMNGLWHKEANCSFFKEISLMCGISDPFRSDWRSKTNCCKNHSFNNLMRNVSYSFLFIIIIFLNSKNSSCLQPNLFVLETCTIWRMGPLSRQPAATQRITPQNLLAPACQLKVGPWLALKKGNVFSQIFYFNLIDFFYYYFVFLEQASNLSI